MGERREKILIIGAGGQIGIELTESLSRLYGHENVIASDVKEVKLFDRNTFEKIDALDDKALYSVVKSHGITQVYHLAAMLSATGEQNPAFAWKLNMESLFHVLELAREKKISKIYWPSSIAVFGPTTPRENTPQYTVMEPSTVYGISKQAGERWCEWYHNKFGVDVRSLRYPGLIGWKSAPGKRGFRWRRWSATCETASWSLDLPPPHPEPEETPMYRSLARWCYRRHWTVIAVWMLPTPIWTPTAYPASGTRRSAVRGRPALFASN